MKNHFTKCLEVLLTYEGMKPEIRILCFSATAASINSMDAVDAAISIALETRIVTHLELYESLLQTYLFAGFPAAIESLSILHNYLKINDSTQNLEYDTGLYQLRGEILCQEIYTNVYDKMRAKFQKISPDLDQWMIIEGYGKTLSRPGLKTITRELISASSLAALGWENQFYSHIRGALNVGAAQEECRGLIPILKILCTESRCIRAEEIIETVLGGTK